MNAIGAVKKLYKLAGWGVPKDARVIDAPLSHAFGETIWNLEELERLCEAHGMEADESIEDFFLRTRGEEKTNEIKGLVL